MGGVDGGKVGVGFSEEEESGDSTIVRVRCLIRGLESDL